MNAAMALATMMHQPRSRRLWRFPRSRGTRLTAGVPTHRSSGEATSETDRRPRTPSRRAEVDGGCVRLRRARRERAERGFGPPRQHPPARLGALHRSVVLVHSSPWCGQAVTPGPRDHSIGKYGVEQPSPPPPHMTGAKRRWFVTMCAGLPASVRIARTIGG